MTGCVLVLRIQSFENFLTHELCSSLSKLLSCGVRCTFWIILIDDSGVLHFANFEKLLKTQSFDNFLTDERCSTLSKLPSKWCKIDFFKDLTWWLVVCCILQTSRRLSQFRASDILTDERCSSLSSLLSIVPTSLNFYKILLDDWFVLHFAMVQEGSQNS